MWRTLSVSCFDAASYITGHVLSVNADADGLMHRRGHKTLQVLARAKCISVYVLVKLACYTGWCWLACAVQPTQQSLRALGSVFCALPSASWQESDLLCGHRAFIRLAVEVHRDLCPVPYWNG